MKTRVNIKNFSLKFIDIMIGIILGLGFQWWPNLEESWQFVAFAFVYLDIVDYWIDYGPVLKKFPPKREVDIFLDLAICFSLFLYIYSTQYSVIFFIAAFMLLTFFDMLWYLVSRAEYAPKGFDRKYVNTWIKVDLMEIIAALFLILSGFFIDWRPLPLLLVFITMRIFFRIFASYEYKKIYLTN